MDTKIAAVQMNCENGQMASTLQKMLSYVEEAADHGAKLVILRKAFIRATFSLPMRKLLLLQKKFLPETVYRL